MLLEIFLVHSNWQNFDKHDLSSSLNRSLDLNKTVVSPLTSKIDVIGILKSF